MFDMNLSQLRAFLTTVELGSLEAAADDLHITPSAVSQRLKALESAVGRVLLERSKPVRATPSGDIVLRLARQIDVLSAETAEHLEHSAELMPSVPLAINADSLATWVLPALAPHAATIAIHLAREDEGRSTQLLREGKVMAAITTTAEPIAGCTSVRLGTVHYRPRCTKHFAATWFTEGVNAATLTRAPAVVFDDVDELTDRYLQRHMRKLVQPPIHYIPSTAEYAAAVQLGMGWGLIPDTQTLPRRIELIEMEPSVTMDVKLYWQQWKRAPRTLDAVAASIMEAARQHLA